MKQLECSIDVTEHAVPEEDHIFDLECILEFPIIKLKEGSLTDKLDYYFQEPIISISIKENEKWVLFDLDCWQQKGDDIEILSRPSSYERIKELA